MSSSCQGFNINIFNDIRKRIIEDTTYIYEDDETEYDFSKDISLYCYEDYSHDGLYCYG